jgi:hypothetical protein
LALLGTPLANIRECLLNFHDLPWTSSTTLRGLFSSEASQSNNTFKTKLLKHKTRPKSTSPSDKALKSLLIAQNMSSGTEAFEAFCGCCRSVPLFNRNPKIKYSRSPRRLSKSFLFIFELFLFGFSCKFVFSER